MIVYLDTSTLVKLYVDEAGSDDAHNLIEAAEVVAASRIAYVEAIAAFVRRLAAPKPTKAFRVARQSFARDWPNYLIIEVNENISRLAADLAEKHRLRGFDCIHLASAVFLRRRLARPIAFSSADTKLNDAARKEGLDTRT